MLVPLLTMIALHFLCDYPLQGDFLSRAKNRKLPLPGVPWYQAMTAHAFIHAGAVSLVGNWEFGIAEFFAHFAIDHMKCHGAFGEGERAFNIDQALHILSKAIWWLLL